MSIKTIEQYIGLLESIMLEWEKVSGVNRQRQGQVGAYEGKATSQQAIVQSSHITEDLFRKFARLEQRDMQALLDYSKEAWIAGKKGMYVMSDGTIDYFDVDAMDHLESEYGIFVSDAGRDQDKLDTLKALAQSMVQNGVPASTVAEMVDADSFTEIKHKIKGAEKAQQELQQAQQQAAAQQAQQEAQLKQQELDNENMNKERDREVKIQVAEIAAQSKLNSDSFNMQKAMADAARKDQDIAIRQQANQEKARSNSAKERLIQSEQEMKMGGVRQDGLRKDKDLELKEKALNQKKKQDGSD